MQTLAYPTGYRPFTIEYVYDATGTRVIQISQVETKKLLWKWVGSDNFGRVTKETFGDDSVTDRTYDDVSGGGAVRTIQTWSPKDGATPTVQDLAYEYDDRWRLKKRTDNLQGHWEAFCYDDLDRLTDVGLDAVVSTPCAIANPRYHYEYDADGNLKYKSGVGSYVYDSTHAHAVQSAGPSTYTYDANGNRKTRRLGTSFGTMTYAPFGLPVSFTDNSSNSIGYEYDSEGRRAYVGVSQERSGLFTTYVGDLYRLEQDHLLTSTYTYYVRSPERIVAIVTQPSGSIADTLSFIHTDHLGSGDTTTDTASLAAGKYVKRSYDPFGGQRNPDWTNTAAFTLSAGTPGFTGHEDEDPHSVGVNMRGRIYDPSIGRFLTPDPSTEVPYNGQGWNPYSYVLNNPMNFTDPTGFACMANGTGCTPEEARPEIEARKKLGQCDDSTGEACVKRWREDGYRVSTGQANASKPSSHGGVGARAPGIAESRPTASGGTGSAGPSGQATGAQGVAGPAAGLSPSGGRDESMHGARADGTAQQAESAARTGGAAFEGKGNGVLQGALTFAAVLSFQGKEAIRTDGTGSPLGIPGGRCETCQGSKFKQSLYLGAILLPMLQGVISAVGRKATAAAAEEGAIRMGLGLKRGPAGGYRAWSDRMGFKTWDEIAPAMYGGDLPRVQSAMGMADELHFNMEGFVVPSKPTLGVEFGEPISGYTNFEYSLMRTQYPEKSFFWLGSEPFVGPHRF